jgi:penicillin-binding protein 1C
VTMRGASWQRPASLVFGVALAVASIGAQAQTPSLPSFDDVRAAHRPSDWTLLDRHGLPVQTLRIDKSVRRLPWVALADMSPALLQAVVLSEDRRFHEHSGVDWAAVARSAWGNVWNTRTRGASTLTMQLAGLIDDGLARPGGGRSLAQKIGQAVTATRLDARWKKSEILEAYLNSVAFRGEVVGINALSQTLFGKHPSGLDAQEAAIAAALVRGPNAPAETVAARACGVLKEQGLACTGVVGLAETALVRRGGMPLGEQLAPHFARQVLGASSASARAGRAAGPALAMEVPSSGPAPARKVQAEDRLLAQRSTLDAGLQRVAVRALRGQLAELTGRNVEDGAVIVLDNASGEVLAWVGSSGDLSGAAQVDGVLARRQPGSTLKPFIYELAFEKRLITPASLLDDAPAQIATAGGLYLPQNYDRDFKGWVSARTALGASLNVPAVRVAALLGPDAVHARLNQLGFALPHGAGHYGHALALGGAEVTLLALANAYRSFALGGRLSPVKLVADEPALRATPGAAATPAPTPQAPRTATATPGRAVADPAAVYLTTHILADNNARVRTFGLDSALATRGFAAVKTGTSKDLRDNWCVGFTDRYTVGVWVGNASGAAMHGVSGISGAAPVWQALVAHLHAGQPSRWPAVPAGVVEARVQFDAQREPARDEWFVAGTEQRRQRAAWQHSGAQTFGIVSPRDGSVFALDPDMPPVVQRIRFEGEAGVWMLDGKRLGAGPALSWAPWPGRHTLVLLGRDGKPLHSVRFEVRGAGLKTALAPLNPRAPR